MPTNTATVPLSMSKRLTPSCPHLSPPALQLPLRLALELPSTMPLLLNALLLYLLLNIHAPHPNHLDEHPKP
eukprot:1266483-Amphidinium_carterae.2